MSLLGGVLSGIPPILFHTINFFHIVFFPFGLALRFRLLLASGCRKEQLLPNQTLPAELHFMHLLHSDAALTLLSRSAFLHQRKQTWSEASVGPGCVCFERPWGHGAGQHCADETSLSVRSSNSLQYLMSSNTSNVVNQESDLVLISSIIDLKGTVRQQRSKQACANSASEQQHFFRESKRQCSLDVPGEIEEHSSVTPERQSAGQLFSCNR